MNKQHFTASKNLLHPKEFRIEDLYTKYKHKVYQKCLRMSGSEEDAYDLSQEVWIKIYAKLSTFQFKSHPTTWLYSITHNHCIDFLRKKNKEGRFIRDYSRFYRNSQSHKENDLKTKQLFEQLESQINHYREHEKLSILWEKYSKGKTIHELSDNMAISESAVKMRLQRAKKAIRQKVKIEPID